jgi:polyhydroxyalkanoate synthesis regulator phasin
MPEKKTEESPEKQFERFRKTVQDMVDAGELNPTEAEERFERAMDRIASSDPFSTEKKHR